MLDWCKFELGTIGMSCGLVGSGTWMPSNGCCILATPKWLGAVARVVALILFQASAILELEGGIRFTLLDAFASDGELSYLRLQRVCYEKCGSPFRGRFL